MASIQRFLSLFETTVLHNEKNFSGSKTERFGIKTGSRLVFSLVVTQIDAGAQVTVTVNNTFSLDFPFEQVLQFGTTTAVSFVRRIITDFHSIFDIQVDVTGGNATFAVGVTVNDNALSTRIDNAIIDVDLSHIPDVNGHFDSVRIGDGVDLLGINPDGSINVNIVQGSGGPPELMKNTYDEALAVASGSETDVVTYTVPVGKTASLQRVEFSGENIAQYRVYLNGSVIASRRTKQGGDLSGEFVFEGAGEEGLPLAAGDVVRLTTLHGRPANGNFEGRIQVLEIG